RTLYKQSHYISRSSFINATPPCYVYTLSLHDALPISNLDDISYTKKKEMEALNGKIHLVDPDWDRDNADTRILDSGIAGVFDLRSEEHTSELQSRENLVCRLLLEKKNTKRTDKQV